jgi:hypothetical protein|tara:strand:+ start:1533 stop:1766 length:234 start_codon:yes stop_codon:yes gene_type:complete
MRPDGTGQDETRLLFLKRRTTMTEPEQMIIRALSQRDQLKATLREHKSEIENIARHEEDDLKKTMAIFVFGELVLKT